MQNKTKNSDSLNAIFYEGDIQACPLSFTSAAWRKKKNITHSIKGKSINEMDG